MREAPFDLDADLAPITSLGDHERPPNGADLHLLQLVPAASLADHPPPERRFLVPGLIPSRNVTMLAGDGGVGKSLLALMLCVAVASGAQWLGADVAGGLAIYISAEDELDEVHRRLDAICRAEGAQLRDLTELVIAPLAGKSAVLATEGKAGTLMLTTLWETLSANIIKLRPVLIVLDTSADFFAGNEIVRSQVRSFIGALRGLAMSADCAVLLLSHPSVAGMASGSGTSGSTAWHNCVRSRIYLRRPAAGSGDAADSDLRILESMKSNYGPIKPEIQLRWSEGRFVNTTSSTLSPMSRAAQEGKAERIFLDMLGQFIADGRDVSARPSSTFAPTVFATHPDAQGMTKRAFGAAMERLFRAKRIRVEQFGPASRLRSRIVSTGENEAGQ